MAEVSIAKVKFRITSKKIIAVLIILSIPVIYYLLAKYVLPIYTWNYLGYTIAFRANLRDAQNVPVSTNYQDSESDAHIRDALVRDDIQNITFLFKDAGDTNNTLYSLEETEIIKALTFAYVYNTDIGRAPNFNAQEIFSYSNITATNINPKIVLVHPNYSNETVVREDGYIIYVEAKNTNNFNTDKVQFDLASVRLMMAILNIKIQ